MAGVALDHLIGGLEASIGDVGNGELLVISLLSGDGRGVGHKWEVNTGVGDLRKNLTDILQKKIFSSTKSKTNLCLNNG